MNKVEVQDALTESACRIADQQGLPFARRVRYSDKLNKFHQADLVVRRNSRCIYLSSEVSADVAISMLEDGVLQAARLDFGILTEKDIERRRDQLQAAIDRASYDVTKATRRGDWDAARRHAQRLQKCIDRLENWTDQN